jgi:hypothetical protein
VWFVPLLIIGLLIGMSFTIFLSPAIGVPLLVLAGIFGGLGWFGRHSGSTGRVEEFRQQAQPDVDFTERDRDTLTPPESDPTR